jgi:hypothetical protein
MEGDKDPDNRRAMNWEQESNPLIALTKAIAKYRSTSDTLKYGIHRFQNSGGQVLRFERIHGNDKLLIIANFTNLEISTSAEYKHLELGNARHNGTRFMIEPKSMAIFKMAFPT